MRACIPRLLAWEDLERHTVETQLVDAFNGHLPNEGSDRAAALLHNGRHRGVAGLDIGQGALVDETRLEKKTPQTVIV